MIRSHQQHVVVSIHGVGAADPGATIYALVAQDADFTGEFVEFDRVLLNDTFYDRAIPDDGLQIVEVNWSEIRPRGKGAFGLFLQVISVITAMFHVLAVGKLDRSQINGLSIVSIYRIVFAGGLVWSIYPMIMTMYLYSNPQIIDKYICISFLSIFVVIMSIIFSRYDRWYIMGAIVWAPLLFVVGLLAGTSLLSPHQLTIYITKMFSFFQMVTLFLLLGAAVEVLIVHRRKRYVQIMARLAFVYMPYLIATGIGSVIWCVGLSLVSRLDRAQFENWSHIYTESLSYQLVEAEIVATLTIMLCGMIAVSGVLFGSFIDRFRSIETGRFLQDWLGLCLVVFPIVLLVNPIYLLVDSIWGLHFIDIPNANAVDVYLISSLRLVPFLPFVIGPLGFVFKILSDILFYVCPDTSPLSIRTATISRVTTLLKAYVRSGAAIHLIAHSQGTVIAVEAAKHLSVDLQITTMGSPIESLYRRFLAIDVLEGGGNMKLFNIFRSDDYIAGPIQGMNVVNHVSGKGGHLNYWRDFSVRAERLKSSPIG